MELEIIPFLKIISDKIEYGFLFFQYMWIVGYYLEFCWNRMKSIKVSSIPTHSCIDSINRTRGSTSCGLSHNLTCIWQMWIHIYMYQSNLQATHVNLILVQNHAPSVPFGLLRFPNCLECPVSSGLGNLSTRWPCMHLPLLKHCKNCEYCPVSHRLSYISHNLIHLINWIYNVQHLFSSPNGSSGQLQNSK